MRRMRIMTKQAWLAGIAERWRQSFSQILARGMVWIPNSLGANSDSEKIYKDLLAKGPDITTRQANMIIGSKSWTQFECSVCEKSKDELLRIEFPEICIDICWQCTTVARDAFNGMKRT